MGLTAYILIFIVSLIVLLKSSDFFVDSAEKIGLSFGVSPFVIGVTIVAFGTSLPELATSIISVFQGASEIVAGTVVGSNITNILLVLGATLLIGKSIKLEHNIWDMDMPMLLISALFTYFAVHDGTFSLIEGILFCIGLVMFLMSSLRGKRQKVEDDIKANWKDYLILVAGGIGVTIGANYVVVSITEISTIAGVPAEVISLSALALGTSLPEVMVSVAAARKGKSAIAVGNVLGSNIFNTYAVLGISRLFGDLAFSSDMVTYSIPFMLGVTLVFAITCISGRINRWEGAMMILLYMYYLSTLIS